MMDGLFSTFAFRRNSTSVKPFSSCDDLPNLYTTDNVQTKKRKNSKSTSRYLPPSQSPLTSAHLMDRVESRSNEELVDNVDHQLTQIREKLAMMREQDLRFRERMDSLSSSVSELASRSSLSSFTSSECSDLGSLDEVSEGEECEEQTIGQRKFSNERLLRFPTIRVSGRPHFNRLPVKCAHTRQSSDPSSMYSHPELPEENTAKEAQRHSTYSADQAMCLYPQYANAEEISTVF